MSNAEIDGLKQDLKELKADISFFRKKGTDMLIAELKSGNILSKIKMAEATLAQKDINVVRNLLAEARKEVPELPKENLNKQSGELFMQLKANIAQAKKDIAIGNKKEATEIYQKIVSAFPSLDAEQKRQLLPECKAILLALR
jgi:5-bromo-4-chloroindolyl phosphate hydrolysis protein